MGEELPDLGRAHLLRVALAVEEDEAPDPVRICLLGPDREVAEARDGADAVQELRLVHGSRGVGKKVLKALAGEGHYTRAGRAGEEKIRLLPPYCVVRLNHSAFTAPLRS